MAIVQITLTAPRAVVYPADTALLSASRSDFDPGPAGDDAFAAEGARIRSAWEDYSEDYRIEHLLVHDVADLTIFWVRSLTEQEIAHVSSLMPSRQMSEMIARGVTRIDNLQSTDGSGDPVPVTVETTTDAVGPRLSQKTMEHIRDHGLRLWIWAEVKKAGELSLAQRKSDRAPPVGP